MRSGKGREIKYTGDVYKGEWENNKFNGKGCLTLTNGDSY